MRRFVLATVVLALCGCANDVPGVSCSDGEHCEKGVCVDGICVDPNCTGCTALQDCVVGLCQDAFTGLEIVAPIAGATVAPGVEVAVEVKLLRRDASSTAATPPEIKLVLQGPSTFEWSLAHSEGDFYRGTADFPSEGSWTLMAKLPDAGIRSEKVAVEVIACTPECATPKDECVAGTCQQVLTGIAIVEPAEAGTFGATVPVAAEVQARVDAYTPLPEQVTLRATLAGVDAPVPVEVALTKTAGEARYLGDLTVTQSGTWTLTARVPSEYGDLASQPKNIQIDAKPPALTLAVQYPSRSNADVISRVDPELDGPYVRRDEYVAILINADEPVDFAQAELVVKDASNVDTVSLLSAHPAPEGAPTCPPGSESTCMAVGLKLWDPALKLPMSRGTFTLTAKASDQAGNRGGSTPVELAVTRFKWSAQLGGPLATAPAVAPDGTVVVAVGGSTTDPAQKARVKELDSEGMMLFDVTGLDNLVPKRLLLAPASAGVDGALPTIVVGGTTAVSSSNTGSPVLVIQGSLGTGMCPGEFSEVLEIALLHVDSVPYVAAVVPGVLPGSVRIAAARLSDPANCVLSASGSPKSGHPGIAVDGATVYVPGATTLYAYTFVNGGFTQRPVDAGGVGERLGPIVTRLGIAGITTHLANTLEYGSVFLAAAEPIESDSFTMALRGLVSGSLHKLVATTNKSLLLVFPDTLDAAAVETPVSGAVSTLPTLGANGTVFLVNDEGVLEARGENESWTMSLGAGLGSLAAFSPALDCGRKNGDGLAGRPGVAYVGTQAGTLFAVITDSPGLDAPLATEGGTAERIWPKWAHDPQNTANADTSLAGHSCR